MAKHKQKLKHVHCQGNPAGVKPGAIVAPSVDGAPILTVFEKAMDLVQGGADLQAAAVIGSDPSDTSETEQSNGLSFTAGTAKIKAIKFTSPSSIKVGGSDGSAYTWTVDATGHTLSGHLGGPSGAVAIILNLSGLFRVAPGGRPAGLDNDCWPVAAALSRKATYWKLPSALALMSSGKVADCAEGRTAT